MHPPLSAPVLEAQALADWLGQGGVAVFPTDTLPALAASPSHAAQIWHLKQRPAQKPLILMGASLAQLQQALDLDWPEPWLQQAQRCWPGAVTLVLPIRGVLTEALHPGGASLGLRVPACPQAQELLHRSGPLATTSANLSGQPPVADAQAAAAVFPQLPRLGPLPWPRGSGVASSVLAWTPERDEAQSSAAWQLLRDGGDSPR